MNYNAELYQRSGESLADYMARLRATREGGILGNGNRGLMSPVANAITEPAVESDASQASKTLDALTNRLSASSESASSGARTPTNQESYDSMRWALDNPWLYRGLTSLLPAPLQLLTPSIDSIQASVWNEQNEATKKQGLFDRLMKRDGDVVLGDQADSSGSGSLVTGKPSDPYINPLPDVPFTEQVRLGMFTQDPSVTSAYDSTTPAAGFKSIPNIQTPVATATAASTPVGFTSDLTTPSAPTYVDYVTPAVEAGVLPSTIEPTPTTGNVSNVSITPVSDSYYDSQGGDSGVSVYPVNDLPDFTSTVDQIIKDTVDTYNPTTQKVESVPTSSVNVVTNSKDGSVVTNANTGAPVYSGTGNTYAESAATVSTAVDWSDSPWG